MNNEQAKFILRAYRPNGRDAGDAVFGDALRQAGADPNLRAWLAREQAWDAVVTAKLHAIVPPAEMREAILAGAWVSTTAARPSWRPATWLALAASIAVMLGLAATYWYRSANLQPAGLEQMARFALVEPEAAHNGPHADRLGTVGGWLQNPANRLASGPPVNLAQLKAQGCRSVSVAGHEVFEICFQRSGSWYHLYIARRDDFDAGAIANEPVFRQQDQRSAVAWADRRLAYVLMAGGNMEALRRIL